MKFLAPATLLAFLLSGLLAAPGAAQQDTGRSWQREPLRLALERLLSWNFDADVRIGAIEGPLIPEIVLTGVEIDIAGHRFATLDAFRMRVDVWALFRDEAPFLEALALEGARFSLVRGASGEWLIPGRKPTDAENQHESSDPAPDARWIEKIGLGHFAMRRSVVTIRESGTHIELGLELELRDLTLPLRPGDLRRTTAELSIEISGSGAREQRIATRRVDRASVQLALSGGRLSIIRAEARSDLGTIRLAGFLELSQSLSRPSGQLTLDISGLTLAARPLGDLHLRLASAGGDLLRIEALELSGGGVPVQLVPEPLGATTLRIDRGLASDGLTLAIAGQRIRIEGGIEGDQIREFRVRAESVEIAALASLFEWPGEISGTLDAELSIEGPVEAPGVTGTASWQSPRIGGAELASVDLAITSRSGEFQAELRVAALAPGRIRFGSAADSSAVLLGTATLPYGSLQSLFRNPLGVEGARARLWGERIELAIFEPFTGRLAGELAGFATLDVEFLGGELPRASGSVELSDGSVFVPLLHRTFAPINGALHWMGDSLTLDSLQIGSEGAWARVTGRLGLKGLAPATLDLTLSMQHFPVSRSRLLRASAAGEVRVSGPLDALVVTGRLALLETRVRLEDASDPVLHEIRILASESTANAAATRFVEGGEGAPVGLDPHASNDRGYPLAPANEPSLFDRAAIELELELPTGRVRGRGADLSLSGVLQLSKQALAPARYSGAVSVVRGSYIFQGRRFEIRRGVLSFDGGSEIDPVVDIAAVYRVRDVEIHATLTGRLADLHVQLESDPPMRDSEVLSYLILGRPSDESPESQGFGAAAGQLAAGVAISEITPLLEDYLPIDTLDLRMGSDPAQAAEIAVGKYLSGAVFVSVGRTLGRDPVDTLRIEWQLSDHFSLESEVSDDENAGLELIWNFDF